MPALGIGDPAPPFALTAAVTGRPTGLPADAGRVLVLIFHGTDDSAAVEPVNTAVRRALYSAEQVLVASVLDLSDVPPSLHGAVRGVVDKACRAGLEQMPDTVVAAEYVIALCDWRGSVTRRYRARGRPTVVVIDTEGDIAAHQRGGDLTTAVTEILPHIVPVD